MGKLISDSKFLGKRHGSKAPWKLPQAILETYPKNLVSLSLIGEKVDILQSN